MSEFGNNYLAIFQTKILKVLARMICGVTSITLGAILVLTLFTAFANIWWFNLFNYARYHTQPHTFIIEGRHYDLPNGFFVSSIDSTKDAVIKVEADNYRAWRLNSIIPKRPAENDSTTMRIYDKIFSLWVHTSFSNRFNGEESHYIYGPYKIDMYHDVKGSGKNLTLFEYYVQIPQLELRFIIYGNQPDDDKILNLIKPIAFPSLNGNFEFIENNLRYDINSDHL